MIVVIPIVGLGKRFIEAGYEKPKPLILVKDKLIIEHAIESLDIDAKFIFIIRESAYSEDLKNKLFSLKPNSKILEVNYLTDGSASSILLAKDLIDNDEELITTNCDQITNWQSKKFLNFCRINQLDGCVATYPFKDIQLNKKSPYSFIKADSNKFAVQMEEKLAISNLALCGIHYWQHGKYFVSSAEEMIKNNDRVNNEFYVSKTFNYLIKENKKISYFALEEKQFISLGTPEDVEKYKNENI
jgi:NDP-sugar pyrophosphorylase family protein